MKQRYKTEPKQTQPGGGMGTECPLTPGGNHSSTGTLMLQVTLNFVQGLKSSSNFFLTSIYCSVGVIVGVFARLNGYEISHLW